jgi:predicted RNase H-like nuclease
VASAKLHGTIFSPEEPQVIESFVDVVDQRPAYSAVALNVPIGYLDQWITGGRTCDRETRKLLGRRGAAVHSAPIRAKVDGGEELVADDLDAISKMLLPKYREVANEMAPYRQRTVYEVHPELSFFQLNDDVPLTWAKWTQAGREERRTLLEKRMPNVDKILSAEFARVPLSHLLDVAALLWTARRVFAKSAVRIPLDGEWDEQGLRMEIVY